MKTLEQYGAEYERCYGRPSTNEKLLQFTSREKVQHAKYYTSGR